MISSEETIRESISVLNAHNVDKICELLRTQEIPLINYLANFVASICDVDKDDLFVNSDKIYIAQARWLFWYAYRIMTNESYEKIADRLATDTYRFTPQGITFGANKMSMMIEKEPMWKKRWTIVKRIIKAYQNDIMSSDDNTPKVIIKVSSELRGKIKIEYIND